MAGLDMLGDDAGRRGEGAIATLEGQTMGGNWRLRLPAAQLALAGGAGAVASLVQAVFDELEQQMSGWRADSDLSRLNATPLGDWVEVPPDLLIVARAGLDMMARCPGVFSVLLGGASARWGFTPGQARESSARRDALEIGETEIRRLADISLDLNALAKGYAADRVAERLRESGVADCLVEVAGDIVARGRRPDGLCWTVALELPIADRIVPASLVPLRDCAIATSGGYRRKAGAHSHLLEPQTGQPLPDRGSVTVLAPTGMEADAWATVFYVLGRERGLALAERNDLCVAYIEPSPPEGFAEFGSQALLHWLKHHGHTG